MNKYCEDTTLPTVANKLAEMIVDFETRKKIRIEDEDDLMGGHLVLQVIGRSTSRFTTLLKR